MPTTPAVSLKSSPTSFIAPSCTADVARLVHSARRTSILRTLSSSAVIPSILDNNYTGSRYQTRGVQILNKSTVDTQVVPIGEDVGVGYHGKNAGARGKGRILVWFRGDLRLDDNPVLCHALEEGDGVVCVYCFDERNGASGGIMERGRTMFLRECVEDVREGLRKRGGDLIVRVGIPEKVVAEIVKVTRCRKVFCQKDVTYHGMCVEDALEKNLKDDGEGDEVEIKKFWCNTLYREEDLPFDVQDIPNSYTKFRSEIDERGVVRDPLDTPERFSPVPDRVEPGKIPTLVELGFPEGSTKNVAQYYYGAGAFVGGESEALKRIEDYVCDISRVDADFSPHTVIGPYLGSEFSNRISPWLALGCVSPRRVFKEMKHKAPSLKLLLKSSTCRELTWRDYFKYTTYLRNCSVFAETKDREAGPAKRAESSAAAQ